MNRGFQLIICCLLVLLIARLVAALPLKEQDLCKCEKVRELSFSSPPRQGPAVLELQQRLAKLGFYQGPADGVYGPKLAEAVQKLRKALGLTPGSDMDDEAWLGLAISEIRPVAGSLPPPAGEISILVDIDALTLIVYSDGMPFKLYPIAIGRYESPTPVGEWKICEKRAGWHGATGVRWLRLSNPWGSYGIHGTNNPNSIGQAASAGCVRMFNHHVVELYDWVDIGTPVLLKSSRIHRCLHSPLKEGVIGQEVVCLQWRLGAGF